MGVGWSEGEHGFTDGGYFGGGDADRGHVGFDLLVAGGSCGGMGGYFCEPLLEVGGGDGAGEE